MPDVTGITLEAVNFPPFLSILSNWRCLFYLELGVFFYGVLHVVLIIPVKFLKA